MFSFNLNYKKDFRKSMVFQGIKESFKSKTLRDKPIERFVMKFVSSLKKVQFKKN